MSAENNDRRIYTMAEETPAKAVIKMGLPVTMGMLFMVAYNLVDTYFIGLLHDDYQLAAANLSYPVMMIMIAISGIVGNGGASYIARCIGAKKQDEADRTLSVGFALVLVSSLVISVLGLAFLSPLIHLLGAKENTFEYTRQYIAVMMAGSFFTMGNYAFGQLLRSEGSTLYSMVGMIAGTVANIILDPVFIFVLGMEIRGAAIATVIGNAVGVIVFIGYYISGKTLLCPSVKLMRFDGHIIGEIFRVGIPHTLEQLFTTAAMIVNNNLASAYGELTVAAMGISGKIMSFGNYVYQGFAAGCQPLMGYNYGAGNYPRMKKLIKAGVAVTTSVELVILTAYGVFAVPLVSIFSESEEVITIGAKTLRAAMLILPFVGSTSIVRNTYNAIGKPLYAFGITVVRQLILYIPMLLIFNTLWGYDGLIHAQPAEEMICMMLSLILLFSTLRRMEMKSTGIDSK